jgi:hypothetical protein
LFSQTIWPLETETLGTVLDIRGHVRVTRAASTIPWCSSISASGSRSMVRLLQAIAILCSGYRFVPGSDYSFGGSMPYRADVCVLGRREAERVHGRRERGDAGTRRPHGAVPQERHQPSHRAPPRQGPGPHRRRRVEAPPQGRALGLQHGQDQDDDGDHVRLRSLDDVPLGGGAWPRAVPAWSRGGRPGRSLRGAHRRRDLAHGVREQLHRGEEGVPGAAGAAVPRLLHHLRRPGPNPQVPPHREEPQDVGARP